VNTHEDEIDERLKEALVMENPDILVDLCHLNTNRTDRFDIFWKKLSYRNAQLFTRGDMGKLLT
jgi:hypothetical protein